MNAATKNAATRALGTIMLTLILLCSARASMAAGPATQTPNMVSIDNFSFSPATLTVSKGATVTWVNHDDIAHTVVNDADPRAFKSPPMDSDDRFSYTFTSAGTYKYFCSIHPHMVGLVVVK